MPTCVNFVLYWLSLFDTKFSGITGKSVVAVLKSLASVRSLGCIVLRMAKDQSAAYLDAVDNSGYTRATEYVQVHCGFLTWVFEHHLLNILKTVGRDHREREKKQPYVVEFPICSVIIQYIK